MWTRIVFLSVALLATLWPGSLLADAPQSQVSDPANLLSKVRWLRLEVVGGRIAVKADRCSVGHYSAEAFQAPGIGQTLKFESHAASFVLHYEAADASSRLVLYVDERRKLTLTQTSVRPGGDIDFEYIQPATGKVVLRWGGPKGKAVSGNDLWQLLLVHRELCETNLLPALESLQENWKLDQRLDQIEAVLAAHAGTDVLAERQQWLRWLDDLSHPEFSCRQEADRSLRQVGQPVLALLRQIEPKELNGEQRTRVKAIVADLADHRADSPDRVSCWLRADRPVWLALMQRGALEQRIAAAGHLSRLCQQPVQIDPGASRESQRAQLAELAAKLVEN